MVQWSVCIILFIPTNEEVCKRYIYIYIYIIFIITMYYVNTNDVNDKLKLQYRTSANKI